MLPLGTLDGVDRRCPSTRHIRSSNASSTESGIANSFTLNGNVRDVRQFRIGGIGALDGGGGIGSDVSEPESWLLMVASFGFVGFGLRRRMSFARITA